jgi:hypothetical protein
MKFGITDLAAKLVDNCKYHQYIRFEGDILHEDISPVVLGRFSRISIFLDS